MDKPSSYQGRLSSYQGVRFSSPISADLVDVLVLDAACGVEVVVADDLGQAVLQVADIWFDLGKEEEIYS